MPLQIGGYNPDPYKPSGGLLDTGGGTYTVNNQGQITNPFNINNTSSNRSSYQPINITPSTVQYPSYSGYGAMPSYQPVRSFSDYGRQNSYAGGMFGGYGGDSPFAQRGANYLGMNWGEPANNPTNVSFWQDEGQPRSDAAESMLNTLLPWQTAAQNSYQWMVEDAEARRRWDESTNWQRQLDTYNMGQTAQQQALAQWQAQQAANQWNTQFGFEQAQANVTNEQAWQRLWNEQQLGQAQAGLYGSQGGLYDAQARQIAGMMPYEQQAMQAQAGLYGAQGGWYGAQAANLNAMTPFQQQQMQSETALNQWRMAQEGAMMPYQQQYMGAQTQNQLAQGGLYGAQAANIAALTPFQQQQMQAEAQMTTMRAEQMKQMMPFEQKRIVAEIQNLQNQGQLTGAQAAQAYATAGLTNQQAQLLTKEFELNKALGFGQLGVQQQEADTGQYRAETERTAAEQDYQLGLTNIASQEKMAHASNVLDKYITDTEARTRLDVAKIQGDWETTSAKIFAQGNVDVANIGAFTEQRAQDLNFDLGLQQIAATMNGQQLDYEVAFAEMANAQDIAEKRNILEKYGIDTRAMTDVKLQELENMGAEEVANINAQAMLGAEEMRQITAMRGQDLEYKLGQMGQQLQKRGQDLDMKKLSMELQATKTIEEARNALKYWEIDQRLLTDKELAQIASASQEQIAQWNNATRLEEAQIGAQAGITQAQIGAQAGTEQERIRQQTQLGTANIGAQTTQRGQDITASTERRGQDIQLQQARLQFNTQQDIANLQYATQRHGMDLQSATQMALGRIEQETAQRAQDLEWRYRSGQLTNEEYSLQLAQIRGDREFRLGNLEQQTAQMRAQTEQTYQLGSLGVAQRQQQLDEMFRYQQLMQEANLYRERLAAEQQIATMQAMGRNRAPTARWQRNW